MSQECPETKDKLSSILNEYRTVEKKRLKLNYYFIWLRPFTERKAFNIH
ncbi:MAG: hypothetical protein ACFFG0_55545 [Candidatus Thorarchaeota archaeon]